jgi:hypothetical protein
MLTHASAPTTRGTPPRRCSTSFRLAAVTLIQLWVSFAESERELGLDISEEAIAQLKAHQRIEDDEFAAAALEEKRRRHDVMAHVHTYGLVAPQGDRYALSTHHPPDIVIQRGDRSFYAHKDVVCAHTQKLQDACSVVTEVRELQFHSRKRPIAD